MERTRSSTIDEETGTNDPVESFGYISGKNNGDHCLSDFEMVANTSVMERSVPNIFDFLSNADRARFAGSNVINPTLNEPRSPLL